MTTVSITHQQRHEGTSGSRAGGGWQAPLARMTLGLLGLAVLLVLWWIGTAVLPAEGSFARHFSPVVAIPKLGALLIGSDLPIHILVSLKRVLVGLSLALVIGVPVGLAIGSSSLLNQATSPAFQFCA